MMLPNAKRTAITGTEQYFTRTLKKKNYELTDHLGNVRSVITDMKMPNGSAFLPDATTRNYYYPFGMERPGMTAALTGKDYRFGFNGKEKMDDIYGKGNALDFGARIHDPRVGRWLSVDPEAKLYTGHSPYNFALNNPTRLIDAGGKFVTDERGNVIVTLLPGQKKTSYHKNTNGKTTVIFEGFYGKILTDKGNEVPVFVSTSEEVIISTEVETASGGTTMVTYSLAPYLVDNSYNCTGNAFLHRNLVVESTDITPELLAQDENYVWGLESLEGANVPSAGDVGTYSHEEKDPKTNQTSTKYEHFEKFLSRTLVDTKGGSRAGPVEQAPYTNKQFQNEEYNIIHKLTDDIQIVRDNYVGPLRPNQVPSSSGFTIPAETTNSINVVTGAVFNKIQSEVKSKAQEGTKP